MVDGTLWKRATRGLIAVGGFGVTIVLAAQIGATSLYADRILPGVHVASVNVGGLTRPEARARLAAAVQSFRLTLRIDNTDFVASAAELGLRYDLDRTVGGAYRAGRQLAATRSDRRLEFAYDVDARMLNGYALAVADKIGTQPVDAAISLRGTSFVPVADRAGIGVEPQAVVRQVAAVLATAGQPEIKLASTSTAARLRAADLAPSIQTAEAMATTPVVLRAGERTFAPTPAQVASWLAFAKVAAADGRIAMEPSVDPAKVAAYVKAVARQVDVAAVDKKVNVENGVSKVTQEGRDGQAVDQAATTAAIVAALTARSPLDYGLVLNPVAFKTTSTTLMSLDYGRYIEVNLTRQHLWVWQDHSVVYETPITSGAAGAGFATVTGLFDIKSKVQNTRLRGYAYGPRYNYDVAVKYWMPFYSGYGFHDASWRNGNFGGQDFYYGGSHGCVNLPDAAAAWIFDWATVGTPVWVHK